MPEGQARMPVGQVFRHFSNSLGPPEFCSSGGRLPAELGGGHFSLAEMLLIEHAGKPLMGFPAYTLSFPAPSRDGYFHQFLAACLAKT